MSEQSIGSSTKSNFKDVIKSIKKTVFLHVCAKEITAQVSARTETNWVWMIQKYFKKQNQFCRAQ